MIGGVYAGGGMQPHEVRVAVDLADQRAGKRGQNVHARKVKPQRPAGAHRQRAFFACGLIGQRVAAVFDVRAEIAVMVAPLAV